MILMLPIDKFDRRMDAEHLENNTMDVIQVNKPGFILDKLHHSRIL